MAWKRKAARDNNYSEGRRTRAHLQSLVKHGKASWVYRRYSVEEACAKAGLV